MTVLQSTLLKSTTLGPIIMEAIVDRERWMSKAKCSGNTRLMFPKTKAEEKEVKKRFCLDCPVSYDCLTYAIIAHEEIGIWGYTNSQQRKQIYRQLKNEKGWLQNQNLLHKMLKPYYDEYIIGGKIVKRKRRSSKVNKDSTPST